MQKSFFALALCLFCLLSSCEHDYPEFGEEIYGRWNVAQVKISAIVLGVPVSQEDNEPVGYVTFNEDGWGLQKFTASIFGQEVKRDTDFRFRLSDNAIFFNEGRSDQVSWHRIINHSNIQQAKYVDTLLFNQRVEFLLTLRR